MFIYISNGIAPFLELGLCYQIVRYTMVGGMGQIGFMAVIALSSNSFDM